MEERERVVEGGEKVRMRWRRGRGREGSGERRVVGEWALGWRVWRRKESQVEVMGGRLVY